VRCVDIEHGGATVPQCHSATVPQRHGDVKERWRVSHIMRYVPSKRPEEDKGETDATREPAVLAHLTRRGLFVSELCLYAPGNATRAQHCHRAEHGKARVVARGIHVVAAPRRGDHPVPPRDQLCPHGRLHRTRSCKITIFCERVAHASCGPGGSWVLRIDKVEWEEREKWICMLMVVHCDPGVVYSAYCSFTISSRRTQFVDIQFIHDVHGE